MNQSAIDPEMTCFLSVIMLQDVKYVIITPVRDEEEHIEATIEAVAGQTIEPTEWVIVDDGSSDSTGDIIDRYAAKFPWISSRTQVETEGSESPAAEL